MRAFFSEMYPTFPGNRFLNPIFFEGIRQRPRGY